MPMPCSFKHRADEKLILLGLRVAANGRAGIAYSHVSLSSTEARASASRS